MQPSHVNSWPENFNQDTNENEKQSLRNIQLLWSVTIHCLQIMLYPLSEDTDNILDASSQTGVPLPISQFPSHLIFWSVTSVPIAQDVGPGVQDEWWWPAVPEQDV